MDSFVLATRSRPAIRSIPALVMALVSGALLLGACSGDDESGSMNSSKGGSSGSGGSAGGAGASGTGGASGTSGASGSGGSAGSAGTSGSGGSTGGSGGGQGGSNSGGSAGSGGSSSGGTSPDGAAGSTGGSGGDDAGTCNGTHPLVDGGTRFCAAGQCRCENTDTCYPTRQAAQCCRGPMRCFAPDGGVACEGTHPLVDGSARFCEAQRCYCPANDACYPAASARACCGEAAQCR